MWDACEGWEDFVRNVSHGYDWPCYTPEGAMKNYQQTKENLKDVRERLKNPVSRNGGVPLKPSTIRQLEREEKALIRREAHYKKFIKQLVKYNFLPTNKLISGADRRQFFFSLPTMLELPELGRAVYYANRLLSSRYNRVFPSTNDGYVQCLK